MKKPRKKISKMGWGVKWKSGRTDFYTAKRSALEIIDFYSFIPSILFRCKIEEVTK